MKRKKPEIEYVVGSAAQQTIDGYNVERNHCTVTALAVVAEIPYKTAHAIAEAAGRKPGRKFNCVKVLDQAVHALKNAVEFKKVFFPPRKKSNYHKKNSSQRSANIEYWHGMKLYNFLKNFPKGRFYVQISGHVFAVIDGVAVDPTLKDTSAPNPLWKVSHAWELVTKKQ